jgi:hypothetical protein
MRTFLKKKDNAETKEIQNINFEQSENEEDDMCQVYNWRFAI